MTTTNTFNLSALKTLAFLFLTSLLLFSCKKNNEENSSDTTKTIANTNKIVGYLYTTTNGEGENEVVQLARHEDGTVSSPENSTV